MAKHHNRRDLAWSKAVLVSLLAVAFVLTFTTAAIASGFSKSSSGSCDGSTPQGTSKLAWWGYYIWDWGRTWSYL